MQAQTLPVGAGAFHSPVSRDLGTDFQLAAARAQTTATATSTAPSIAPQTNVGTPNVQSPPATPSPATPVAASAVLSVAALLPAAKTMELTGLSQEQLNWFESANLVFCEVKGKLVLPCKCTLSHYHIITHHTHTHTNCSSLSFSFSNVHCPLKPIALVKVSTAPHPSCRNDIAGPTSPAYPPPHRLKLLLAGPWLQRDFSSSPSKERCV